MSTNEIIRRIVILIIEMVRIMRVILAMIVLTFYPGFLVMFFWKYFVWAVRG